MTHSYSSARRSPPQFADRQRDQKVESRIFIVEDEPIIAADMSRMLRKQGCRIVGISGKKEQALKQIETKCPDLVILDINLEGNTEGIEIAQHLQSCTQIPFVFVSSYFDDQTVRQARSTNPLSYLLKPFREEELLINIGIALHKKLEHGRSHSCTESNSIFVRSNGELVNIPTSEIFYVQAEDNYTFFYTAKGRKLTSSNLKTVEEVLAKYNFVRVHRSYLVNPLYIDTISEGLVRIRDHQIPIGRTYRKELFDSLTVL